MMRGRKTMRKLGSLAATVVLIGVAGCMTIEVQGDGTPWTDPHSETVHGSLYGFRWAEFTVDKCDSCALSRVEYHTNALCLLAAVVSLGLYVPQTVEWWCCESDQDDTGEDDTQDDTGDPPEDPPEDPYDD